MNNKTEFKRSACAIANTLDILGDKWTLLVIRDLFFGKKTYSEFQKSPERIPTNILAERLKRLESAGIINKQSYQQRPVRYAYQLTAKGEALAPVLKEMVIWGNTFIPDTISMKRIEKLIARQKRAQS
ncbi:MAG: helix-turn-helix transcriptional regulator [gamma proteobacterium symbiont of Bathyaustriella thionipta]|nr:helix-turn-helix transcriptional regulator [gamma proteobacterium symbiont of Bathyaustriella thionipta]MCU7951125.1 helix-turn-helix transcriptional regulator [gamma proteobacterium symbiont of Bathyaustriella thionipta]MCU7954550.1 helix-turn-helix transcriptional regulator [gamma proteobacterium symbiont of Bathyaustriella thionipta]MCU7957640.1 helix-turn-helix transcriptional regulator [gamma proteobacterium symbiont of Bathyaustriella thionipta]MCU7966907.1 helix-turn-helix transcripti